MPQAHQPNRHLIAFITFLSLVPLVYIIPNLIAQYLVADRLLNVILSLGIIVPIISYLIVPISIKKLKL